MSGVVFKQIQDIILYLYTAGIEYPDITGYNFIEYNDKIWIIDFGHATMISPGQQSEPNDSFVKECMMGENTTWNPHFD